MTDEELRRMALDAGFSAAAIIDPASIRFAEVFRSCCEDNHCGNYNRNYSCPPACGTVEEMIGRTKGYTRGLLMRTSWEADNVLDEAELKPMKQMHSAMSRELLLRIRTAVPGGLAMAAGCCTVCPSCTMPEGKPCRFPAERISCMSAYCINVAQLAKTAGLEFFGDGHTVYFFSLYLYNPAE